MPSVQPVRLAYNTHEPVTSIDETLAPIIYLHGMTDCKESWGDIPQIVANATKRRSYSLDARNHGDSEWSEDFGFDLNVVDVIHFMDTLEIQKAILVGHSMGGVTSIKAALTRPDRVEKIIVEDMHMRKISEQVLGTVSTYIKLQLEAIEKVPADVDEDGAKKCIMRYIFANFPSELSVLLQNKGMDEEAIARDSKFIAVRRDASGKYVLKNNMKVLQRSVENLQVLSAEPEGQFDGPACFIYGTISPFLVGADEHHIKQFFPKAILVGVEDADHSVHVAKPLEFTDALLKFVL